jgi:predicted secreted protein
MRSNPVIFVVSECIYNQFCKPGCRLREDKTLEELKIYLAKYPCILILKCPEEEIFGIFRFNETRKMLEKNCFFVKICRNSSKEMVQRIDSYIDAIRTKDGQIPDVIIIGVDGSPSCGVDRQLNSDQLVPNFGRPKKIEDWKTTVDGSGILIEILKEDLRNKGIPFEAVGVENLEKTKRKLIFLDQKLGEH